MKYTLNMTNFITHKVAKIQLLGTKIHYTKF